MTGGTLPPWTASNERDRHAMERWVVARLDELDAAEPQRQADNFPPVTPSRWRNTTSGGVRAG